MKESEIQKKIIDYMRLKGYFVWKNALGGMMVGGKYMVKNPNAGMPDLCAVKDGITHYIEVKTPKGRLSEAQKKWHATAYRYGVIVHVVRSIDDVRSIFL